MNSKDKVDSISYIENLYFKSKLPDDCTAEDVLDAINSICYANSSLEVEIALGKLSIKQHKS